MGHDYVSEFLAWWAYYALPPLGLTVFLDALYVPLLQACAPTRMRRAMRLVGARCSFSKGSRAGLAAPAGSAGLARKTTPRDIRLSAWAVFLQNAWAVANSGLLPALATAAINRGLVTSPWRIDYDWGPLRNLWLVVVVMLVHDLYYYSVHRALHANRWLFAAVHAHHHSADAELSARTGLFISGAEGHLMIGVPLALLRLFEACTLHNELAARATGNTLIQINILGHIGHRLKNPLPLLVLNPFIAAAALTGTPQSPQDHQAHHERPRTNLAAYFRHWDELLGTAAHVPGRTARASSLLLISYNLVFYGAVSALMSALWAAPLRVLGVLLPLAAALAVLPCPWGGLDVLRRSSLWDTVRRAYGCSIEGASGLDPERQYMFAYHPHGALARGWWLTFGLQGRDNPLSTAGIRVSLGTHRVLLAIPGLKQALAAIGCCGVDGPSLTAELRKPGHSVTICPGGWAEGKLACTNKVLLKKRRGFLRLALKMGATLVPVLGVGEAHVAKSVPAGMLVPTRPCPLKVVIGSPVEAPEPAPSDAGPEVLEARVDDYMAAYTDALLALGKRNGMELQVM